MLGSFLSPSSARCRSPSRLRRASGSSDRRLLPLAVTARGLPKLCDDATDVTATCDRSRRDVPLPVRPKRPEEEPDDGRDDGRSPRDARALGDPSSDGDRRARPDSSSAARSSVGVFGSPSGTLVSGCIRRISAGLGAAGSFGDKRGRPTLTKTIPKQKKSQWPGSNRENSPK